MAFLYGRAGRLTAQHGGVRPGQVRFPSIPPNERFFFVFKDADAKVPQKVAHLQVDEGAMLSFCRAIFGPYMDSSYEREWSEEK